MEFPAFRVPIILIFGLLTTHSFAETPDCSEVVIKEGSATVTSAGQPTEVRPTQDQPTASHAAPVQGTKASVQATDVTAKHQLLLHYLDKPLLKRDFRLPDLKPWENDLRQFLASTNREEYDSVFKIVSKQDVVELHFLMETGLLRGSELQRRRLTALHRLLTQDQYSILDGISPWNALDFYYGDYTAAESESRWMDGTVLVSGAFSLGLVAWHDPTAGPWLHALWNLILSIGGGQ